MTLRKIIILGTGGTIAGTASCATDNVGYVAGQVSVESLIGGLFKEDVRDGLETEQLSQIDSKDMSFEVWSKLARRVDHLLRQDDVAGIVVTHGTDTIEETAYFIQALLAPAKPVVFTCAMRPASSISADGPQNLVDAVTVARQHESKGSVVVCAGVIHSAIDVMKVHPYRLDPFSSGDSGPIGVVEEGILKMFRSWPTSDVNSVAAIQKFRDGDEISWPKVEIVLSHTGSDGSLVTLLQASGVQAIVVAATGNGSVHYMLQEALIDAQSAGLRVLRASRCANGRIIFKPGDQLQDSGGLSPSKARVRLIVEMIQ